MKHKVMFIILAFTLCMAGVFAQVSGDFRSKGSGTWSNYTTWQRYNGSAWADAVSGETPSQSSSVWVQSGHIVSLSQNQSVKDLHISKGTSNTNATNGRVQLATYSLELYGKLRTYYAAVGTVPGTSTTTMANMLITCTGSSGKLVVKGSANRTIVASTEWSDGTFSAPPTGQLLFNMEIAPDSGVEINMEATIRAYSWNIVSGALNVANAAIVHADQNSNNAGDVSVGANGTIIANSSSSAISFIRRMNGKRGGTFTLNGLLKVLGTDTAIAMSTVNLNGTVEYARNGAQNFVKNGGDGAVVPSPCTNVTLSGSGTKTLATNLTINGTFKIAGTAGFAVSTYSLTYGSSSTLEYAGTSSQNTTNAEFPASSGPKNVVINNSNGVTLNSAKTVSGNLTLQSGTLALGSYALDVQGTTYIDGGTYTGGTGYTDGYDDVDGKYFMITANDVNMTGFSSSTAIGSHYPAKTDREWTISGTFTGSKTLTLYWTSSDDHNHDWIGAGQIPSVYLGGTEYTQSSYNVTSDPRWVSVNLSSFAAKGFFLVGPANDVTLPVELSSFTAVFTADFFVKLHWVTQSETGVSGFYVYRGINSDLSLAARISPMINATNSTALQEYEYTDFELYESGTYYYWLQVQDMDGGVAYHGPTTVYFDNSGSSGIPGIPVRTGFTSIYPNPFNPRTTIGYGITKAADVSFSIYNQRGQLVRTITEPQKAVGYWKLEWDGTDLNGQICPTGIYYIRMQAGTENYLRKAILLK
ncbi:hypothetical protein MASR1M36_19450 [Candidatus Cloacimonadaceae bacterium]